MTASGDTIARNSISAGISVGRGWCTWRVTVVLTAAILLAEPTTSTTPATVVSAAGGSIMHARHHQHQHLAIPSAAATAVADIRGGGQHRDVVGRAAVVSPPVARHDDDDFDDVDGAGDESDDDESRCLVGDSLSTPTTTIHARHHHHHPSSALQVQEAARGGGARAVVARGGRATTTTTTSQSLKQRNEFVADLLQRLKITSYFALWYVLNVVYNIINKKVLNAIPAPLTIGSIQFLIGALYASTLWLLRLRPTPRLTPAGRSICAWVGLYHMSGQLFSMVSMGAGPISFTHIVKALEPFFSAVVSALVFGRWMKPQVYATLVPVVGGVGYACMKERHFSWLAFSAAMGSNMAFALRAVVSKSAMTTYIGDNLSSTNLFGVVTWFAFFLSVPVALLGEGTSILSLWSKAVDAAAASSGGDATSATAATGRGWELARAILVSGLFHYLNNEVMYLALGNVHPVTLAVGNTMKRVFILVASVLVFRNPVSLQAAIGSAIGISGVLLYSLTRAHYEKLEAEQQAA